MRNIVEEIVQKKKTHFVFNIFFPENLSRTFKFNENLTITTGTLNEDQAIFLIISRSVLVRMRNIAEEIVQKIKKKNTCSIFFFP